MESESELIWKWNLTKWELRNGNQSLSLSFAVDKRNLTSIVFYKGKSSLRKGSFMLL